MSIKKAVRRTDLNFNSDTRRVKSTLPSSPNKFNRTKIFNLHSNNIREVENLKVTSHDEYGKNGKLQTNKYVEYMIIGNNRKWEDFMTVKDFKKLNPKVAVEGLN